MKRSSSTSITPPRSGKRARAMQADTEAESIAEVRQSLLPGAGMGAFAVRDIAAGEMLGTYKGRLLSPEEYESGKPNPYVLRITMPCVIYVDASDPALSNWTRFINAANYESDVNVRFTANGCIESLRPMERGEEFLVSYGDSYWDNSAADANANADATKCDLDSKDVITIIDSDDDDDDDEDAGAQSEDEVIEIDI